jgi:YesN/AraC family two-component response regulator
MISFKNLRFLIVDDDRDIRETLKEHLELYEAICDEAQDGLIAFDKIKNNKYDFVISDIRMPNASGIEL